jgi:hypothetical protein
MAASSHPQSHRPTHPTQDAALISRISRIKKDGQNLEVQRALKVLSPCAKSELNRLLKHFLDAFILEHVRRKPTLRATTDSTRREVWGPTGRDARAFIRQLKELANSTERLQDSPAWALVEMSISDKETRSMIRHAVRWLPGMLTHYRAGFERLKALARQMGRKGFNLAHDQERLLVSYIKGVTGSPHYREAEVLLAATQRMFCDEDRSGDEALEQLCRRSKRAPVSIERFGPLVPMLVAT